MVSRNLKKRSRNLGTKRLVNDHRRQTNEKLLIHNLHTVSVNASQQILVETHDVKGIVTLIPGGNKVLSLLVKPGATDRQKIRAQPKVFLREAQKSYCGQGLLNGTYTWSIFWSYWRASNCDPSGAKPAMLSAVARQTTISIDRQRGKLLSKQSQQAAPNCIKFVRKLFLRKTAQLRDRHILGTIRYQVRPS